MTKAILAVIVLFGLPVGAFASSPDTCPGATGVYFYADHDWMGMDLTRSSGFTISGLYTRSVKAIFRDRSSPYQQQSPEVRLCLVGIVDSGRDLTLAKFTQTKKERELLFGKAGLSGFKMEIEEKGSVPLSVSKLADKTYLAVSKSPVADREYILLPVMPEAPNLSNKAMNISGYDIGVHGK